MHFVGNRAIVLGNGQKGIQLYYNSGFTALSAFLPVIFLFFGFTTVELRQPGQRFFWPSLLISAVIAGLAITGMHYVGNFGITNYHVKSPPAYIVGAAAIAIFASTVALSMFYYFKEKWINSLPRRIVCACILAGAVSGMHWLATMGTTYQLSSMETVESGNRNTNLIIAIVIVSRFWHDVLSRTNAIPEPHRLLRLLDLRLPYPGAQEEIGRSCTACRIGLRDV